MIKILREFHPTNEVNFKRMNYTNEIMISLPRSKVIELFDNSENMKKWQKGLINYEFIEGKPGKKGSKMKLLYEMGKRKIEMIETITQNSLPNEFHGTYEAKGVFNIVKNYFIEINKHQTKWIQENEFNFTGFMRFIAPLMKGSFKKQTCSTLEDFKTFAEKH